MDDDESMCDATQPWARTTVRSDLRVDAEPFRNKPELDREVARLRPFTDADIASMGPILADPVVLRLTGSVHTTEAASNASAVVDEFTLAW